MVAFKTMWNDVCGSISNNKIEDIEILEEFKSGFVVKDKEDTHFVTKDDFVDFWCNMLCFNKVEKDSIIKEEKQKLKYVYEIVKTLPYINEKEGILRLSE
ncbi:hypothetical protein Ccar_02500 [Clostridium carboxidivorans P7]|uniref:Uncharacterized protein n=1 Tax=Clostridium carboxidivorans P7 TaxID=536227 RepID=C6Q1U1_9CLOT|nr:hypothetical protein [Clostridium carboxidivorans]AKN29777.1 hypothetical protein Ccar_02500 [Clostridium carboxidivorans P7]EET84534.1 conserved hypothetical protein [Clostridium carboxidivorans P7]EFG89098.1 hypothetical protein CLCAR_1170 [Clostridium carboxidivorans P7]